MKIDAIGSAIKDGIANKNLKTDNQDTKIREICQEFESVFISYLLKGMRKTIPDSEFSGKGFSREIYTSMMDEEIAHSISKGPGVGLADVLYRQFMENKKS